MSGVEEENSMRVRLLSMLININIILGVTVLAVVGFVFLMLPFVTVFFIVSFFVNNMWVNLGVSLIIVGVLLILINKFSMEKENR